MKRVSKREKQLGRLHKNRLPKRFADSAGIRHMFCEPDLKTKLALGYQGTSGWLHHIDEMWDQVTEPKRTLLAGALEVFKDFPPREQCWLNKIQDALPPRSRTQRSLRRSKL
jgi:hypothetical protein